MLSYQHIYHAGNMADVQKHLWLLCALEYLGRKEKPFCWLDTHSGRGAYDLAAPEAQKLGEYKNGILSVIERLRQSDHPLLELYAQKISDINEDHQELRLYPGSALLAATMLRDEDKLYAYELHPKEFTFLSDNLASFHNVKVIKEDGYKGLKSLTPPKLKRGGVLIDPSYEMKGEYEDVVEEISGALSRWPQGVYMIWYPILAAARHEAMCAALTELATAHHLDFIRDEWIFEGAAKGLLGTGMFIFNPPYQSDKDMSAVKNYILNTP